MNASGPISTLLDQPPPGDIELPTASWVERAVMGVERRVRWVLALLMLLDTVLLLYMGRHLTFFYDEWAFVVKDFGGGLHSLLAAHGGNIVVFPVAVYKVLFHLAGLNHYAVYRLVVIVLHLLCAGLIYLLASRRVSRAAALLASALILFLGAAAEDLLWPFQIGYLLSIATGLAAWALLERADRRSDIAAVLCLVVAAGSSSLGIPIMIGVAAELAWQRQWRRGYVVIVPAVLYLLWYVGYGENQVTSANLINAPGYAEDLAAAAFGGLIGQKLEWGRPLALVGIALLARQLLRGLSVSARLIGLLATGASLWFVTAATRSTVSAPDTSRYVYLGAVVILLVAIELLREVRVTRRATALAVLPVAFFAITGLTLLHDASAGLRMTSATLTADLGALEIAAAYASSGYKPNAGLAPDITAGPYLHTVRAIGSSPAASPAAILASDPATRARVDGELVSLERAALVTRMPPPSVSDQPPSIASARPGPSLISPRTGRAGRCWLVTSAPGAYAEFVVPPRGLLLQAASQPANLTVRRFAPAPGAVVLGVVPAHGQSLVRFPPDDSTLPWLVRLANAAEVCALR